MSVHMCEVLVDGASWKFNTMPGMQCVTTFAKFMHLIGEPGMQLLGKVQSLDTDLDPTELSRAIGLLTERASEGDLASLIQVMLAGLLKDGKAVTFDMEFSANMGTLLKLFLFSAKENFGSFLPALSTIGSMGLLEPLQ